MEVDNSPGGSPGRSGPLVGGAQINKKERKTMKDISRKKFVQEMKAAGWVYWSFMGYWHYKSTSVSEINVDGHKNRIKLSYFLQQKDRIDYELELRDKGIGQKTAHEMAYKKFKSRKIYAA